MKENIVGIMGAMPEEIDGVLKLLSGTREISYAGRTYHTGTIHHKKVVVVISGWGKVAAAATVSTLIHRFDIGTLIFTGVAGAIDNRLKIGDIVVASRLLQHDMDARPFIPRYEIPLLKKTFFECSASLQAKAQQAAADLLSGDHLHRLIPGDALQLFGIQQPGVYSGDIASGDQFFSDEERKQALASELPGVLCVEMEGAAVAQVCYESAVPFIVIRTISDAAGAGASIDFAAFIEKIAGRYSAALVAGFFETENI